MKHLFKFYHAAIISASFMLLFSCKKEELLSGTTPNPISGLTTTITGNQPVMTNYNCFINIHLMSQVRLTYGDSTFHPDALAAFNSEYQKISGLLQLFPQMIYFNDNAGINAFAVPVSTYYSNYDTVKFGMNLMYYSIILNKNLSYTGAIMAHEFGHIADFTYNPIFAKEYSIQRELTADYIAGYYMGIRTYYDGTTNFPDVRASWGTSGDWSGTSPTDAGAHGTGEQRMAALQEGYNLGVIDIIPRLLPNTGPAVLKSTADLVKVANAYTYQVVNNIR